jgi:hypothetical protein
LLSFTQSHSLSAVCLCLYMHVMMVHSQWCPTHIQEHLYTRGDTITKSTSTFPNALNSCMMRILFYDYIWLSTQ